MRYSLDPVDDDPSMVYGHAAIELPEQHGVVHAEASYYEPDDSINAGQYDGTVCGVDLRDSKEPSNALHRDGRALMQFRDDDEYALCPQCWGEDIQVTWDGETVEANDAVRRLREQH